MLSINFTQFYPGLDIHDVRANQSAYRSIFMGALAQALDSIRRSKVNVDFEAFNVSTMVSRRLQNSELQLYNVETNENRQLQTICHSVEKCLKKYQNVKILKVVQQITVPLPMNVDAAEYSRLLLNLLIDQNYFGYLRDWASRYGVDMSYNITTTMCGYTSFDQCDTLEPTALPSFNPSALPSTIPSIAPAVAPTFLPSSFPTVNPTDIPTELPSTVPSIAPALPPTCQPTQSPTPVPTKAPSVAPSVAPTPVPTTSEPTLGPTQTLGE